MVSDDFKPSYNRFLPGSTPEQATVTSTNTLLREPVKPFSATPIPFLYFLGLTIIYLSKKMKNPLGSTQKASEVD